MKKNNRERLLLDIKEVAELTGFSPGSLYHWVSQGRIPFVRISSRCIRFRRSDLEAWLDQNTVRKQTIGGGQHV